MSLPTGRRVFLLPLFALLIPVIACSSGDGRQTSFSEESAPISGGTLHRRLAGNPAHLDPLFIGSNRYELEVLPLLYDELLGTARDMKLDFSCALAESAAPASDDLSVVVRLKTDRKWHDGAPLTVDDFLFTYDLLRSADLPASLRQNLKLHPDLESLEKVDERTMRMRFSRPLVVWKDAVNVWPLPRHIIEPELRASATAGQPWNPETSSLIMHPIGSGPYRLVERREGVGIILERWPDYPGEPVWIERVVLHIIQDVGASLNAFLAAEIDEMMVTPDQMGSPAIRKSLEERGQLVSANSWTTMLVFWNLRRPPFDDPSVRMALAKAVNTEEIIATMLAGEAMPAAGWFPLGHEGRAPAPQPVRYDPEGAVELLRKAGFAKDESELKFEMLHPASDRAAPLAAAVQADLAELGITVEIRPLELATLGERLKRRDFDAMLVSYDPPLAAGMSQRLWHSREAAVGRNFSGLEDPDIDSWFDNADQEMNVAKRLELYHQIDRRLAELQPALFLWHPRRTYAVADRVGGFETSVRGPYAFHPGQRAWWLRDAGNDR